MGIHTLSVNTAPPTGRLDTGKQKNCGPAQDTPIFRTPQFFASVIGGWISFASSAEKGVKAFFASIKTPAELVSISSYLEGRKPDFGVSVL